MRTLIEHGTIVTPSDTFRADLVIEGEIIAAVGKDLAAQYGGQYDRRIDATGKLVIPGGIDVHTHLDMPFGGTTSADDFESGTMSAAFGGTIGFAVAMVSSYGALILYSGLRIKSPVAAGTHESVLDQFTAGLRFSF